MTWAAAATVPAVADSEPPPLTEKPARTNSFVAGFGVGVSAKPYPAFDSVRGVCPCVCERLMERCNCNEQQTRPPTHTHTHALTSAYERGDEIVHEHQRAMLRVSSVAVGVRLGGARLQVAVQRDADGS